MYREGMVWWVCAECTKCKHKQMIPKEQYKGTEQPCEKCGEKELTVVAEVPKAGEI